MALLTVEEVAANLKISPKIIRKWLRDGIMPGVKLGRVWRIDEKDLEEFIQRSKKREY